MRDAELFDWVLLSALEPTLVFLWFSEKSYFQELTELAF